MKLQELFNRTQEELSVVFSRKLTVKTSAMWIAEDVEDMEALDRSNIIMAFFDGSLMMVSQRSIGDISQGEAVLKFNECSSYKNPDVYARISTDDQFAELVICRKGWYDCLNS